MSLTFKRNAKSGFYERKKNLRKKKGKKFSGGEFFPHLSRLQTTQLVTEKKNIQILGKTHKYQTKTLSD